MSAPASQQPQPGNAAAWAETARYFEYTSAADPDVPAIPFAVFPATLHTPAPGDKAADAPSGVVPLDLSAHLKARTTCTSPNLSANFVRIRAGETVVCTAVASSHMFYVISGAGSSVVSGVPPAAAGAADPGLALTWGSGDLFTVPAARAIAHTASADAALYYVNDAPLLAYLGAEPRAATFSPTLYAAAALQAQLAAVTADPAWRGRNRNGVLLGTAATCDADAAAPATLTLTPTLWALYNALPARVVQRPHRHNSVALDLCVAAGPDTYTLMADAVDACGELVPPVTRADWVPGAVFVTPPGVWHSHHNGSDVDAIVLPVQDAGLHTAMRTLNIEFAPAAAPLGAVAGAADAGALAAAE